MSALTVSNKFYNFHKQRILHAAEILAVQGLNPADLELEGFNYGELCKLAGNGIFVPQLGAIVVASLVFVLKDNKGDHMLTPPSPHLPMALGQKRKRSSSNGSQSSSSSHSSS